MSYSRAQIVEAARSYVGTRFKWKGRDRVQGLDCVGLLTRVADDIGFKVEDDTSYGKYPDAGMFRGIIYAHSKPAPRAPMKNGQIGLFKQVVYPLHCGIVTTDTGRLTLINANMRERMVVEQSFTEWASLLLELRDFPEVN